jgi:hypothetical protein
LETLKKCQEQLQHITRKANPNEIATEVKKLVAAFSGVDNDFLIILIDRINANGLTFEQVQKSILFTIDNCTFHKPSIAEIIQHATENIKLGIGEKIINGKRMFYGIEIPMDAPPRPSEQYTWSVYRKVWYIQ